jgi:hypothetical protein
MNVVNTGSAIRLLRLPHHLTIVVVAVDVVVVRETTIDSGYGRSCSINSVRLVGHCWWVILIGTIDDIVSDLMTVEASLAIVNDLTHAVLLSFAICLVLIICL